MRVTRGSSCSGYIVLQSDGSRLREGMSRVLGHEAACEEEEGARSICSHGSC